jgi:hypothetical protein
MNCAPKLCCVQPGVVPLDDLEHRPGVLQGVVALHLGVFEGRATASVLVTGGPLRGAVARFARPG